MKKLLNILIALTMVVSLTVPAFAGPVPVRSLTEEEESFVQDNFDLDYGWEFTRWMTEDIGPRSLGNYGLRAVMDKAVKEWESFGYETKYYTAPAANWAVGNANKPTAPNSSRLSNTGYIEIQGMKDKADDPMKIVYFGPVYATDTAYKFGGTENNRWDRDPGPAHKDDVTGIVILDWSGTGTNGAPSLALTVPDGVNVTGKTVVVRNMTETPTPTGTGAVALNNPSAALYYNTALNLQNAGAAAVIFQSARYSPAYKISQDGFDNVEIKAGNNTMSRIANTVSQTDVANNITIPVGYTLYNYTNDLFTEMSADELANTKINYMMEYHDQIYQASAIKYAKNPTDKTIYFTAHCDTFGSSNPYGPGGNDNASGAGLVMAVAKAYANVETNVNLVFAFFDGEEFGLWGANHFVNTMTHEEKLGFYSGYNFDMIATSQENVRMLSFNNASPTIYNLRQYLGSTSGVFGTDGVNQYMMNVPKAVEFLQNLGGTFDNYAYVAPRTGLMLPTSLLFNGSTSSDQAAFSNGAVNFEIKYPNMTNMWNFDWRRRPYGGNEFEAVYHKLGDDMASMSRERFDITAEIAGLALGYDLGVLSGPVEAGAQAFWFELKADNELVKNGDTLTVTPTLGAHDKLLMSEIGDTASYSVGKSVKNLLSTNTAVLNLKFNKDIFVYEGYKGLELLNTEETSDGVKLTVAALDGYNVNTFGDISFYVNDDTEKGDSTIELVVEYVFKDKAGNKAVATTGAGYEFATVAVPEFFTLIDLSNLIDWFNVKPIDKEWAEARFWDFNSNKEIDISDIVFVAQKIA